MKMSDGAVGTTAIQKTRFHLKRVALFEAAPWARQEGSFPVALCPPFSERRGKSGVLGEIARFQHGHEYTFSLDRVS